MPTSRRRPFHYKKIRVTLKSRDQLCLQDFYIRLGSIDVHYVGLFRSERNTIRLYIQAKKAISIMVIQDVLLEHPRLIRFRPSCFGTFDTVSGECLEEFGKMV